ncbi:cilia- and flagella-associated protein 43 [Sabethes cyaneus]|uniref:cilia- and flagella-associated protein 43 n=1 Tax=Sabethes cyaneus TaxID=53552 RepID=UPI00237EB05C|nr:cilia- and flagella-associated protein 43 [Sabethes cyaneus]
MSLKHTTNVKTNWIKVNDFHSACFVSNEALAVGMSSHILLWNLTTKTESYYRAVDKTSGEGVSCLTGHKSFSIYAFAEKCISPRIFINDYPNNSVLYILQGGENIFSYISICFSEGEYLIALSGIPDYSIEVHVWRNKEMLIKKSTGIHSDKQRIICSPSSSVAVCQLAYNKPQAIFWEIHGSIRVSKLIEKAVRLPFGNDSAPIDSTFLLDGTLVIVNKVGAVYTFSGSTGQMNRIIQAANEPGSFAPLIYYCKGGLFLRNPNGNISFYKRQKNIYIQIWNTDSAVQFASLLYYSTSNGLYGITSNGNLVLTTVDNDLRNVEHVPVMEFEMQFTCFLFVNPLTEVVVGLNSASELIVIDVKTGMKLAKYFIDKISCMQEHPLYPFISVATLTGIVYLVSLYRPEKPCLLADFYLGYCTISRIRFSEDGLYMVVIDERNNVFVIKGLPGKQMDVIYHCSISITENISHPILMVSAENIEIIALVANNEKEPSNKLTIIVISVCNGKHNITTEELQKKYIQFERKFGCLSGSNRMYAVGYLTNEIDILEIVEDDTKCLQVKIVSTIEVKHQIPHFSIYANQHHLSTWSIDGLVTIFDVKTDKLLAFFITEHHIDGGILLARADLNRLFICTLSYSGYLVCTKVRRVVPTLQRYDDIKLSLETDDIRIMFNTTITRLVSKELPSTRWIDLEKINKTQTEKLKFESTKQSILNDFENIKLNLKEILNTNETATEDEMLPIQLFNLNSTTANLLREKAKVNRNTEHCRLLSYIVNQERANEHIVQKCWSIMERKPIKVRSIFNKRSVENYPSLPKERNELFLQRIGVYRETEQMASHDALLPWKPTPTYLLESILNRDPDYGNVIDLLSSAQFQKPNSLNGTTTHIFVKPMPLRYEQLEVVTFEQLNFENVCGKIEMLKLRELFNSKLDLLKTLKDNEMDTVLKRNNRLRVIQSELSIMSKLLNTIDFKKETIVDPCFQPDEIPETIVETKNDEIAVAQYCTPSMEKVLALDRAEKMRRQQQLMANDFKDRALVVMMDGVLEHRWEDEIKKSPPIPHCLETGKDPLYYNETDIREVKDYEEQLDIVIQERIRYKQLLEVEKSHIVESLENQIKQFNMKVAKCLLEKICIESAIREEEMRILKNTLYNQQRLVYDRKANSLRSSIDDIQKQIDDIAATTTEIQEKVNDYKNTYETLNTKDKMLDKQFKINFLDNAQSAIVDQAYKIFKRRPKVQLRAAVTVSIFQDLAKRITAKKVPQHSDILFPQECLEHLSACENLDQTNNCPTGMDSTVWQTLCKMRRIKMESEFRLKSCEIQLADTEAALNAFQRELASKKYTFSTLENRMNELLKNKFLDSTNRNVQIVMKRGLVEAPMFGKMNDFDSCILIHRTDVDDINVIIKRAGAKKLKAMANAALFRRKIIIQEWEHRALMLRIRDLRDQIKLIEKCRITKEVQEWLKRKETGIIEDLGQQALEREIENAIYSEEKTLIEVRKSVEDLEEKIHIKRKENKSIDKQTQDLNIDVTEQHLKTDWDLEKNQQQAMENKMALIVDRSRLVRLVQVQYAQILELGTMLELQRLKTYPTLSTSFIGNDNTAFNQQNSIQIFRTEETKFAEIDAAVGVAILPDRMKGPQRAIWSAAIPIRMMCVKIAKNTPH